MIVRNGRIAAAACIFPVSQRETLDRSLGLRHRAGLGITEESDAIAVVVSEETGAISICHRRRIERNFTPETFRKRIGEILLHGNMMKKLILNNWHAKLISLLLATTLWYLIKKNVATTPSPSEVRNDRRQREERAGDLAQETREIFFFPAARSPITGKLSLAPIEFFGVHAAPAAARRLRPARRSAAFRDRERIRETRAERRADRAAD